MMHDIGHMPQWWQNMMAMVEFYATVAAEHDGGHFVLMMTLVVFYDGIGCIPEASWVTQLSPV